MQPKISTRSSIDLIQQMYITHCLFDEGLSKPAGFGVRASSTRDPLLLRLAQEYPPFETPPGELSEERGPPGRLARLALLRLPTGQKSLLHSVPLADRHGRANNFLSHYLVCPNLTPRDALRTWGSPDWALDCPPGTGKELESLHHLPTDGSLNDDLVTAFLQPDDFDHPSEPLWPVRLNNRRHRRELLGSTLRGCLLVLQAGVTGARNRFYILGEPDLVALLLFGAVRLLPPHLVTDLTFSTYEPARHTLRTYRHAQVVGTLTARPEDGLDEEFFTTRGYALDTFAHRASRELTDDTDSGWDDWIEQAARSEWKVLDKIHALLGRSTTTAVPLREGFQTAKLVQRLITGKSSVDDLLVLRKSPWGTGLLKEHHEKLWPIIQEASLTDPRIREAFADLLTDNVQDLEQQVAEALGSDPPGNWRPGWRLLEQILASNPPRLRETLQRILPPPPYPRGLRFDLLREVQATRSASVQQQQPLHVLLRRCSSEELEQFGASDLPREWFSWALCYSIVRPETRGDAVRHLQSSPDDLLRTFWEQIRHIKDEQQRRGILQPLLASPQQGRKFLGRSLGLSCPIRGETLVWMLDTLSALEPDWNDFWSEHEHLARLIELLREGGEEVESIWESLCGQLTGAVLLLGNPYQQFVLTNLAAVRDRAGRGLPAAIHQVVSDWVLLREHFENASAVPDPVRDEIVAACRRRGLDAVNILRDYFRRFVLPQEIRPEVLDDFIGFFHSFHPGVETHQECSSRYLGWLEVVRICPDQERRGRYRGYYLDQHVPVTFRDRLREETGVPAALSTGPIEVPEKVDAPEAPAEKQVEGKPSGEPTGQPAADGQVGDSFQLTGIRGSDNADTLLPRLWKGAPWLLCSVAGGVAAAVLMGLFPIPQRQLLLWALFLPLVLTVSESSVLQAAALSLAFGGSTSRRGLLRRCLLTGLVGGLGLGAVGGALAMGVAFAWAAPFGGMLCLGATVASGILIANLLGFTLPLLVRGQSLAVGPITRAAVGVAAVGLYSWLGRCFLR